MPRCKLLHILSNQGLVTGGGCWDGGSSALASAYPPARTNFAMVASCMFDVPS